MFLLTCDDKQDMIKLGYNFVSVIIRKELYYETSNDNYNSSYFGTGDVIDGLLIQAVADSLKGFIHAGECLIHRFHPTSHPGIHATSRLRKKADGVLAPAGVLPAVCPDCCA